MILLLAISNLSKENALGPRFKSPFKLNGPFCNKLKLETTKLYLFDFLNFQQLLDICLHVFYLKCIKRLIFVGYLYHTCVNAPKNALSKKHL